MGCYDRASEPEEIIHPTLVGVAPRDFLGNVPCVDSPGAMRRYIATLYDVSVAPPLQGFALPSSGLVPCLKDIGFSFVALDHDYVAVVQGYDRDDLSQQVTGSPNAVDEDGQVVAPRWTTQCGQLVTPTSDTGAGGASGSDEDTDDSDDLEGEGGEDGSTAAPGFDIAGVTATANFTVYATYCLPFVDHGPVSDTSVSIGLDGALRDLDCGSDDGEVSEFTAELAGASTPPLRAECAATVEFGGLEPGQDYQFNVLAFETDSDEPGWQTTCRATALGGTLTPATCDPLVER